jgi:enoyl-CoA hydratase
MGLHATQTLGPILDGLMRNTPDGLAFVERAATDGVRAATAERDALFDDYSTASAGRRPDPSHVITPS